MSLNIFNNSPGDGVHPSPEGEVGPPRTSTLSDVAAGLNCTIASLREAVDSRPTRTVGSDVFPSPQEERSPPQSIMNQMLKGVRYMCSFSWIKDLAFCLSRLCCCCCCPTRSAQVSPERLDNLRLSEVGRDLESLNDNLELRLAQLSGDFCVDGLSEPKSISIDQIGRRDTRTALQEIGLEREGKRESLPELKKFLTQDDDTDIKGYSDEIRGLVLKIKKKANHIDSLKGNQRTMFTYTILDASADINIKKDAEEAILEIAAELKRAEEELAILNTELDKELEGNFYEQSIQKFFKEGRPQLEDFYKNLDEKGSHFSFKVKEVLHSVQECFLKVSPPTTINPFASSVRFVMEIIVVDWIERENSLLPYQSLLNQKLADGYAYDEKNTGSLQLIFPTSMERLGNKTFCSIMLKRELTFTKNQEQKTFTLAEQYNLFVNPTTGEVEEIKRACTKI